jgi:hypothetical protein
MAKTMEEAMSELRRDVERWHTEIVKLGAEGHHELVERIRFWIAEAEGILARWDN